MVRSDDLVPDDDGNGRGHDCRPRRFMGDTEQAYDLLASARARLAQCDWHGARVAFEAARNLVETPEGLEGLGLAAWCLDDAKAVFEAHERAYQLYRQRGDRLAAGRLAMLIGVDSFHLRGQTAVARGWHRRAQSLLDGLPTSPEHAWLHLWGCEISLATGDDVGRVRAAAAEVVAIGRRLGDADVEMLALAQEGLALVMQGDVQAGMLRLDEAATAALSGEMANPVAIGIASCHLVLACNLVRDLGRAAEWCERVREFSERINFNVLVGACRAQHASVLMWSGAWAEAEAELERVSTSASRVQEEVLVRLAELRRRQGRFDDAEGFLARIEWHPHARLVRATIALDRGDPASAVDLAQRFLAHTPASNRTDRTQAWELLLRGQLALGLEPDPRALEEVRKLAAGVGTDVLRAGARVAEGLVTAAGGQPDQACVMLEDAIGLFVRAGAGYEAARARVELARAWLALGRADAARIELEHAVRVFDDLRAPVEAEGARALLRRACGPAPAPSRPQPGGLSVREVEVLGMLAEGLNNTAIAVRLHVSPFTVKRHVANILTKLDMPTRAAAAAHAAREGWV
jgi:DNA-binding CsgD family transcriptional regulator